jgi:hypothetical protein
VREVHVSAITDTIKKLCMEANWNLGSEMLRAFDKALTTERSPAGKQVLQILKQNKGFVYAVANASNGIAFTGAGRQHFNSSAELPLAVEKCLIKNGVKQHGGARSRKYVVAKGK